MKMKTPKSAYKSQKAFAKQRGIAFEFDLADWLDWWEEQLGPDWFEKRGCRRGQYVMARLNDIGPYARGNIKCITVEDNHTEYNQRRDRVSGIRCAVLPDAVVLKIYHSAANYSTLVDEFRRYGVTKHRIQCIKTKRYYRKLLDEFK